MDSWQVRFVFPGDPGGSMRWEHRMGNTERCRMCVRHNGAKRPLVPPQTMDSLHNLCYCLARMDRTQHRYALCVCVFVCVCVCVCECVSV